MLPETSSATSINKGTRVLPQEGADIEGLTESIWYDPASSISLEETRKRLEAAADAACSTEFIISKIAHDRWMNMALTCSNDRCPLSRRGLLEYYQGNKRIFEKYGTPTTQIAGNDRDILVRTEIANHYKSLCDTAIWTGIPKCLNCVSLTDIEYPPTSIRGWSRYEHLISTKDSKKARSKGKDLQLGLGKGNKPVHGVDLPVWQRHEIDGSTTTLRFWHIGDHLSNSIKTYCSLQHGVAGLIALHKKHLKLRKAGSAESSSTTGKLLMFRDYSPEILDEANQVISRSGITIDDDAVEPQVTAGKRGRSDQKSTSTGLAASGTSISSEAVSAPTATYIGMEEDDESNARPSRLPKLGE